MAHPWRNGLGLSSALAFRCMYPLLCFPPFLSTYYSVKKCVKQEGTEPEARELFTMARLREIIMSTVSFMRPVGTKFRGHMVDIMLVTLSFREFRNITWKQITWEEQTRVIFWSELGTEMLIKFLAFAVGTVSCYWTSWSLKMSHMGRCSEILSLPLSMGYLRKLHMSIYLVAHSDW